VNLLHRSSRSTYNLIGKEGILNDVFWEEVAAHQKQKEDREKFYNEIMQRIVNDRVLDS